MPSISDDAAPTSAPAPSSTDQRRYLITLLLAAALGVPAAIGALLLTTGLHGLEDLLWTELPDAAGWSEPPAWLVILIPMVGGALVAAALRMPGGGGHEAINGLSTDPTPLAHLPGLLLAAFASISFGLVVGPEAPLLAIGLALGALAGDLAGRGEQERAILALAGGFAAMAALFGGPLAVALMLLELTAMTGKFPSQMLPKLLVPGFLAAGVSTLLFTGVRDWDGIEAMQLALPNLPAYPTVRIADVLWTVPVALAAALVSALTMRGAWALRAARVGWPSGAVLVSGGALVGLIAVLAREIGGDPIGDILFSGQSAIPVLMAETSGTVLAVALIGKALAFTVTLAAGFRGGPIFPNVTLGVMVGMLAAVALGGPEIAPAVIAGVAAGAAAQVRAPFFGALLATLLAGSASADLMPIAVIAAVLAWLVASAVDARFPVGPAADGAAGPAPGSSAGAPTPA